MRKALFFLCVIFLLISSCATTKVGRVDSQRQTDLSGYWNDTDVRIVCESLIKDCLSSARVDQEIRARGGKIPTVIVGRFRNESDEQINTAIISSIMETVIFNSGRLNFVAGGDTRNDLRAERQDQQSNSSEATAAALGKEIGADFMLTGSVRTIVDRAGNQTARTYFVTAELTNIETNARMWMGQNNEIKKVITRPRNRL
jgi:uncharacterized protein (TIGR02722 family)